MTHLSAVLQEEPAGLYLVSQEPVFGSQREAAHSLAEAEAAVLAGADYLGVGPCFPTTTKSFPSFAAPEFLRGVADTIGLPAFAIGGITLERLPELHSLGIRRVAVASAIMQAADPAAAARGFLERLAE